MIITHGVIVVDVIITIDGVIFIIIAIGVDSVIVIAVAIVVAIAVAIKYSRRGWWWASKYESCVVMDDVCVIEVDCFSFRSFDSFGY